MVSKVTKQFFTVLASLALAIGVSFAETEGLTPPVVRGEGAGQGLAAGVDDSLLELGVAFVLVSKSEFQKRESDDPGLNGVKEQLLLGERRSGWNGSNDHVRISSDFQSTLNLLAKSGLARQREYGTIRLHGNGDPGKVLHLGGNLMVTPPATGEGETPAPQEYQYGFKVINGKSRRIGPDTAEADFDIEFLGVPTFSDKKGPVKVYQDMRLTHQTIRITFGQTVVVAGYESLCGGLFGNNARATPTSLMRNTPILNWFVSDKGHRLKDLALLLLVSVRKVDANDNAPMVPNTPMKDLTLTPEN